MNASVPHSSMLLYSSLLLLNIILLSHALNFDYLDPTKLQTKTSAQVQQSTASNIISRYQKTGQVTVEVNPVLFSDNKDVFELRTSQGQLHIKASTGVAALWGFNYYLKKYCKSHVGWQVQRVAIPDPLPEVDEVVVANDRFRYYQNVCTASYSFVWWGVEQWKRHVEWMAMNGINLALAPVAQEAAWARIYRQIGMTDEEINEHFTGPAFLSWLRMGNVRGWGGPLPKSWLDHQRYIQYHNIVNYMYELGIVPIFPAFNGHVPKAFSRIYPNTTFFSVDTWNRFNSGYCCGLFVNPSDSLFKTLGKKFLNEISALSKFSHIYTADPFNEVKIQPWYTELVEETAKSIYSTLSEMDDNAVWLLQNWMFVHDPVIWPKARVKSFLTSVPNGRMLILDLQSEQWPQYDLYEMYFGQPFLWCMLHNFGGTLGMFGNMQTINKDVYEVRSRVNSTMIGIGLTPEGINQNYVVYDLMLESAWRKGPINDLEDWVADYAERRYGCSSTSSAWRSLLRSVYSFNGLNRIRGKYVITRRPSFKIRPWAWYKSIDLFEAFRQFAFVSNCDTPGFYHDLVDVTRQALQYRAEQLYMNLLKDRFSNTWVFNSSINQFVDVMKDMEKILATNEDFTISNWLTDASLRSQNSDEKYLYELNARNQITLWGPNGEISDYACKQWAELFHYYYIPRWTAFLSAALDAKTRHETFDEKSTQNIVRSTVENQFQYVLINSLYKENSNPQVLALSLYKKWAHVPGLEDLPQTIIRPDPAKKTTLADTASDEDSDTSDQHTVLMWHSTTPTS